MPANDAHRLSDGPHQRSPGLERGDQPSASSTCVMRPLKIKWSEDAADKYDTTLPHLATSSAKVLQEGVRGAALRLRRIQ